MQQRTDWAAVSAFCYSRFCLAKFSLTIPLLRECPHWSGFITGLLSCFSTTPSEMTPIIYNWKDGSHMTLQLCCVNRMLVLLIHFTGSLCCNGKATSDTFPSLFWFWTLSSVDNLQTSPKDLLASLHLLFVKSLAFRLLQAPWIKPFAFEATEIS